MDNRFLEIVNKTDSSIKVKATPGHFATNHAHTNYYVDLTDVKVGHRMAKLAAYELSRKYQVASVDTIICMEGTEMVGAFMADALAQPALLTMNSGKDVNVLTPEMNASNQMIFRDNTQGMIADKSILLLVAVASTGKTVNRALECLQYYGGRLVGISALFSAVRSIDEVEVHAAFTEEDLPHYRTYSPAQCDMCVKKEKIDAIANSFGYSRL